MVAGSIYTHFKLQQYLNIKRKFIKNMFWHGPTLFTVFALCFLVKQSSVLLCVWSYYTHIMFSVINSYLISEQKDQYYCIRTVLVGIISLNTKSLFSAFSFPLGMILMLS